jgi:hypothetical protein
MSRQSRRLACRSPIAVASRIWRPVVSGLIQPLFFLKLEDPLPKRDLRNARFYPLDLKKEAFSAPQSYIDVANPAFMFGASGHQHASARNSQSVHH